MGEYVKVYCFGEGGVEWVFFYVDFVVVDGDLFVIGLFEFRVKYILGYILEYILWELYDL